MIDLTKGGPILKIPELTSRELTGDETLPNSTATYVVYVVTDHKYFDKHESEVIFVMETLDDGTVHFEGPYKTIFDGYTFVRKLGDKDLDNIGEIAADLARARVRTEAIATLINTQKKGAP